MLLTWLKWYEPFYFLDIFLTHTHTHTHTELCEFKKGVYFSHVAWEKEDSYTHIKWWDPHTHTHIYIMLIICICGSHHFMCVQHEKILLLQHEKCFSLSIICICVSHYFMYVYESSFSHATWEIKPQLEI